MCVNWETSEWYVRWCEPIVAALWSGDEKAIRIKLAEAQCAIGQNYLFEEENQLLNTHLAYLEFQACLFLKLEGWKEDLLPQIVMHLEEISTFEQVEHLRARLLLQIRIYMDRLDFRTLSEAQFLALRGRLDSEIVNSETWYYIGIWAFKYGNKEILEDAFIHFFDRIRTKEFYNKWSYHLIKLLSNLRSNCATKIELINIINLAEKSQQLKSLKSIMWQEAEAQLLVDKQVTSAFARKMDEFGSIPQIKRGDWFSKRADSPKYSNQPSA